MAKAALGLLTAEWSDKIRVLGYDPSRMVDDGTLGPDGFTELIGFDEVTGAFDTRFTKWNDPKDYFRLVGEDVD